MKRHPRKPSGLPEGNVMPTDTNPKRKRGAQARRHSLCDGRSFSSAGLKGLFYQTHREARGQSGNTTSPALQESAHSGICRTIIPGHECHNDSRDRTGSHSRSLLILSILFIMSDLKWLQLPRVERIGQTHPQAACLPLLLTVLLTGFTGLTGLLAG